MLGQEVLAFLASDVVGYVRVCIHVCRTETYWGTREGGLSVAGLTHTQILGADQITRDKPELCDVPVSLDNRAKRLGLRLE